LYVMSSYALQYTPHKVFPPPSMEEGEDGGEQ